MLLRKNEKLRTSVVEEGIKAYMGRELRRGELLNMVWADIDFDARTIEVTSKHNTAETWEWRIKDHDRRVLPLTDHTLALLVEHQERQPEGHPYVFVPPCRYDRIQQFRRAGKWSFCDSRLKAVNNFSRTFGKILRQAGVRRGPFHDLRRTALSNWLAQGMSEHDVMVLAGHASVDTTHRFHLAIQADLTNRARQASERAVGQSLARAWHAPRFSVETV